jgi:hypothetical protein
VDGHGYRQYHEVQEGNPEWEVLENEMAVRKKFAPPILQLGWALAVFCL